MKLLDSFNIQDSGPFKEVDLLKPYFDAEAVQNYASKFLENEEKGAASLSLARTDTTFCNTTIVDMLQIPLILQITCVIYESRSFYTSFHTK